MKKTLMFWLFVLCGIAVWSQKTKVNIEGEELPNNRIVVLDVPNGKVDLQKAKKQLVGRNKVQNGAEVVFQSGEELVMTDGFVVEKGSEFVAEIVEFTQKDAIATQIEEETVFNNELEGDLSVYPNPTTENLFLNLPSVSTGEIYMYGTSGQVVFKREINTEKNIQFSVRDLPVGIYILSVITEKYKYTKKIIKN